MFKRLRTSKIYRFSPALSPNAIAGKIRVQLPKERGRCIGMASPSIRSDTSLFGLGVRPRIAWESGTAQLETPRSLLLGF